MATVRKCDIYSTTKDVRTYIVLVSVKANDPALTPIPEFSRTIDLSPRGLERLKNFLTRGVSKPDGGEAKAQ